MMVIRKEDLFRRRYVLSTAPRRTPVKARGDLGRVTRRDERAFWPAPWRRTGRALRRALGLEVEPPYDPSDAAWAAWESTRHECAAGRHRWGEWWDCQCGGITRGHRLGPDGACDVIIRRCDAICPEYQERQPVTPDSVSDALTEFLWWLAGQDDLPALVAEHTGEAGEKCTGCAGHGMRRHVPCGVRRALEIAQALRASELSASGTGRRQTPDTPVEGGS